MEINFEKINGMTVNERLYATSLLETFNDVRTKEPRQAEFILRRLKIDEESIKAILNETK